MFSVRWTRFFSGECGEQTSPAYYFSSLPVLETPRLVLRPVRRRDAEDIYSYASDPEVARYVLWEPHRSLTETRNYVIGTIGLMWYSDTNCSAEVGYSFSREVWNRGFATEALRAVMDSVFSSLPVNRLEAQYDIRNPASGRVMEKCGMRQEGILRQRIRSKGEFLDVVLCAILRSDLEK